MVGGLKASVSQLEFENEKLRKEVGELKAENSRLDTQLAQESEANGEMAARLDDAKTLIRRQGGNVQAMGGGSKPFDEDDIPPPVTTPKGRRVKSGRTPPTVKLPTYDATEPPANDDVSYLPPNRTPRDLGSDDNGTDDRWLPVARGLPSQVKVRQ